MRVVIVDEPVITDGKLTAVMHRLEATPQNATLVAEYAERWMIAAKRSVDTIKEGWLPAELHFKRLEAVDLFYALRFIDAAMLAMDIMPEILAFRAMPRQQQRLYTQPTIEEIAREEQVEVERKGDKRYKSGYRTELKPKRNKPYQRNGKGREKRDRGEYQEHLDPHKYRADSI